MRTYSELITIPTLIDRFRYLAMHGKVGEETMGCKRYLSEQFYHDSVWRNFRRKIIIRDDGCDLGVPGFEIHGRVIIHHIEAITPDDIINKNWDIILNEDNVICVSHMTHEAITYGDEHLLPMVPITRMPGDTCPWK